MRDSGSDVELDGELDHLGNELAARAEHARRVVGARLFAERSRDRTLRGRYRWTRPLGGGGQGQVWAAHDTRLDREIAIKFVRSDVRSSAASNKWLQHEARALARVRHPRVVQVFDMLWASAHEIAAVGMAVDSAVACIVMELVHGRTMTSWLRERRRSQAEILRVVADVLEGMTAIHAVGLVHCDIKPGNIIIADDGSVKIADLGVARLHRAIEEITHDGAVRSDVERGTDLERTTVEPTGGTPRYMPPEQLEGGRVDASADQYALAVTLFEALFGVSPHRASGGLRLLEDKRRGPPPCPDTSRCSTACWAALTRALAPAPEDRHEDAAAFRAALVGRAPRRRTLVLGAAIAGGIGLVLAASGRAEAVECAEPFVLDRSDAARIADAIGSDGSTFAAQTSARVLERLRGHERRLLDVHTQLCAAESPPPLALRCVERATIDTRSAVQVLGEPQPHLALSADGLVAKLPDPNACIDGAAPRDVDQGVPAARARAIWATRSRATALSDVGRTDEALETIDGISHAGLAESPILDSLDLQRAELLVGLGRFGESITVSEAVYERAVARGDAMQAADAASWLVWQYGVEMRRHELSQQWARHARAQIDRLGGDRRLEIELATGMATAAIAAGRIDDALQQFEAVAERGELESDSAVALVDLRENLGLARIIRGQLAEGVALVREALAQRHDELGPSHPQVARSQTNLAYGLRTMGEVDEAEALLHEARATLEACGDACEVQLAKTLTTLGELLRLEGRPAEAVPLLERAHAFFERTLPVEHPSRTSLASYLIEALCESGALVDAERVWLRASARSLFEQESDGTAALLLHAGGVLASAKDEHALAAERFDAAASHAETQGATGPALANYRLDAADAEWAIGRDAAARAHVEAAECAVAGVESSPGERARLQRARARVRGDGS